MEATNYRIGNLVFDDENEPCRISSLSSKKKNEYEGEEPELQVEYEDNDTIYISKVINPIPLTNDWLLKLNCPKTFLSKDTGGYFVWFNGEKIYIKYVHELQNLYFALRENELSPTAA